jgi:hypothetical protein
MENMTAVSRSISTSVGLDHGIEVTGPRRTNSR